MRVSGSLERSVYVPGEGNVSLVVEVVREAAATEAGGAAAPEPAIESLKVHCYGVEKLESSWVNVAGYKVPWKPCPRPPGLSLGKGEHLVFSTSAELTGTAKLTAPTTYHVSARLPGALPPSFKGTAVRYSYFMVVEAVNDRRETQTLRLPFRVFPEASSLGDPAARDKAELRWTELVSFDAAGAAPHGGGSEDATANTTATSTATTTTTTTSSSITSATDGAAAAAATTSQATDAAQLDAPRLSNGRQDAGDDDSSEKAEESSAKHEELLQSATGPDGRREAATQQAEGQEADEAGAFSKRAKSSRSYNISVGDVHLVRVGVHSATGGSFQLGANISGVLDFSSCDDAHIACQQVFITLETEETIAAKEAAASRKRQQADQQDAGCTIRKVQSEFVEYTSNTVYTSFIFTVPVDGPCTFTNALFSVTWYLCFEFITVAKAGPATPEGVQRVQWKMPINVVTPTIFHI